MGLGIRYFIGRLIGHSMSDKDTRERADLLHHRALRAENAAEQERVNNQALCAKMRSWIHDGADVAQQRAVRADAACERNPNGTKIRCANCRGYIRGRVMWSAGSSRGFFKDPFGVHITLPFCCVECADTLDTSVQHFCPNCNNVWSPCDCARKSPWPEIFEEVTNRQAAINRAGFDANTIATIEWNDELRAMVKHLRHEVDLGVEGQRCQADVIRGLRNDVDRLSERNARQVRMIVSMETRLEVQQREIEMLRANGDANA